MKNATVYALIVLLILSSLFLFSCTGEEVTENVSPSPSVIEKIEIEEQTEPPIPVPITDDENGEELLPVVIPDEQ